MLRRHSPVFVAKAPRQYPGVKSCPFCDEALKEAQKLGDTPELCADPGKFMLDVDQCVGCVDEQPGTSPSILRMILPQDLEGFFLCCEQTKFLGEFMAGLRLNRPASATAGGLRSSLSAARSQAPSLTSQTTGHSTSNAASPTTARGIGSPISTRNTSSPTSTSNITPRTSTSSTSTSAISTSGARSSPPPPPGTTAGSTPGQPAGPTTPAVASNPDTNGVPASSNLPAAIAGSVAGTAALILLAVGAVSLYRRRRRSDKPTVGQDYEKPQLHSDHLQAVQEMDSWRPPGELAGIHPPQLAELPTGQGGARV
ncbi:hypothetical protein RB597_002075 [Gaeumannomyces tritici]